VGGRHHKHDRNGHERSSTRAGGPRESGDKSAKMDDGGLEPSQHADIKQGGGPEMRQQLQQQPKPNRFQN